MNERPERPVEVPQPHREHPTDRPTRTPEQGGPQPPRKLPGAGGEELPRNLPGTSDQEVTPEVERDIERGPAGGRGDSGP
jgi:hypothetical protein